MNAPIPKIGVYPHWLLRIRFQLAGGLFVAILIPALIRSSLDFQVLLSSNLQTTMVAAAVAHILGFFAYRRMGNFPGLAAASYILPTFLLSYGTVMVAILMFRYDYSRFQAVGSFVLSVAWYFGVSLGVRRIQPYRLAIVPGGHVEKVHSIGGVVWQQLTSTHEALQGVSGVVADLHSDLSVDWERYLANCALAGIPVYHFKQIRESLTGRVEIEHLSENTLGSLNPNDAYLKVKGLVDWMAAFSVITLFSPVILILAFAIKMDSKGPAFFRQERVGFRGEVFRIYKFRTMTVDNVAEEDPCNLAMTKISDARITRVGRFLRRTRIDELPQAINILRGEMSWIGPRPEALALSLWYEKELPFYRYRHIVKPGISGWAQVNQGHVVEVDDVLGKLHFDFYYIRNFSPWLDVVITLRTIRTVLTGFGAR